MRDARTRSALVLTLLAAAAAAAQDAPPPVTLGLFSSFTFTHNFNDPPDDHNTLRVYDTREGELSLDVVEAVIQRKVAAPGDAGFRLDAIAGSAIPQVTAAGGLFRDPDTGEAEDFDLLQAYVSYVAPVGRGLRLDIGKHCTVIGYEVAEGVDGWNDAISHSFLFLAEPTSHTGVRASTQLSDAVSGAFFLVTGWDVVEDNNDSASLGFQLGVATPGSPFSFTINYLGGPEKPDNDSDLRHTINVLGKVVFSPKVTLGVELLGGNEEGSAADGRDATWTGVAVYLRTDPTPSFALTLRAETLDDSDGNRTGTAQRLSEATLATQLKVAAGLFVRGEVRFDHSDTAVFNGRDGLESSQPTVALNLVWTDSDV